MFTPKSYSVQAFENWYKQFTIYFVARTQARNFWSMFSKLFKPLIKIFVSYFSRAVKYLVYSINTWLALQNQFVSK